MSDRIAVVVFPGTNCEHDVVAALSAIGGNAELLWHDRTSLAGFDGVILPGGFAHGDYLRPGAIARFSPVMSAVERFAGEGGPVLGICNGFQILCEAGLLPGAFQRNRGLRFICSLVELEVCSARQNVLTGGLEAGEHLWVPINHFAGNYTVDGKVAEELIAEGRVLLRYVSNPNGSVADIAAICNGAGNVVGIMPHPERASDQLLGSSDGLKLLRSFLGATNNLLKTA